MININIFNTSDKPIYEQIYLQIKAAILSGELKEGAAIPSMRYLAKELKISVITTKRAYEELERQGYIVSHTGKGSFVARKNKELLREEHLAKIEQNIREIIILSNQCGIGEEEIKELYEVIKSSEQEGKSNE